MSDKRKKPVRSNSRTNRPGSMKGKQGRADSKDKRVNFDNERISKFNESEQHYKRDSKKCDANDVKWYASNATLLESAASLPMSTSVGMPISTNMMWSVPGVMSMDWVPFINGGNRAPIQQAANAIYSYVVHANSRNYNYDPADLMLMILAGAQAFQAIAVGVRAYGTMLQFNQQDYYTPQALVQAMGFNYTDLRANLSKMWFDLNELIARMQQVWIPNVMPVLERWFWLNSNIYLDASSAKAQYYVFTPSYFLYYNEKTSETGGSLTPYPWGSSSMHTWDQYLTGVNLCIDSLLNAQDRGMIFGDVLKAYGADKLYSMSPIPVDYKVVPQYNMEVMTQIENLTVFQSGLSGVFQDTDGNLYTRGIATPLSSTTGITVHGSTVLNFHQIAQPTAEQIMIATRLKTAGLIIQEAYTPTEGEYFITPALAGTEYIMAVKVYTFNWTNGSRVLDVTNVSTLLNPGTTTISAGQMFRWSAFDWAPWIYILANKNIGTITIGAQYYNEFVNALGDWDNYTIIDPSVLRKMHTTAVYSEFGIPTNLG